MPETGSSEAATVVAWLKRPAEAVRSGEPICRVQWAAGAAEIESPATGVVRLITAAAGDLIRTGATLAVLDLERQEGRHSIRHLFR